MKIITTVLIGSGKNHENNSPYLTPNLLPGLPRKGVNPPEVSVCSACFREKFTFMIYIGIALLISCAFTHTTMETVLPARARTWVVCSSVISQQEVTWVLYYYAVYSGSESACVGCHITWRSRDLSEWHNSRNSSTSPIKCYFWLNDFDGSVYFWAFLFASSFWC